MSGDGISAQALAAARAGTAVVTANRRAARNLRLRYAREQEKQGRGAWPSAPILSWSAWMKSLWQEWLLGAEGEVPVLLDAGQEEQLWRQAIAAGGARQAGDSLYLAAAARSAARAWRLAFHYGLPLEHPSFRARRDSDVFRAWAQAFRTRCDQNQWLDGARLGGFLEQRIAAGQVPLPERALLVGFDELTPQQSALLAAAAARGMAWSQAAPAPEGSAVCVAAPETADEIAAAARWSRRLLQQDPQARIAVVVPELDALRSRVERAFLEALQPHALAIGLAPGRRPFDISLGRPLSAYPVVAAALLGLRLALRPLTIAEAGRLLRSPFFAASEEEHVARARLDASLRRRGRVEVALAELRQAAHGCPQLGKRLGWLGKARRSLPATASPSQWATRLSRLLQVLGWPGDRVPSSEERQALERWRRLLTDFARLGLVRPPMSAAEALDLLAELAAAQIFQPENEGAPVQILGMLEAAGSEFDHMWVMGMHDNAWPSAARPDALLPFALQREHGLPGASPPAQLDLARRITRRLRASAPQVIFSYPAGDGDNRLRPSPLLAEGGLAHAALEEVAPGPDATWARALFAPDDREKFSDDTGPQFPAGPAPGGTRLFQLQSACPFRAFAELRLGADALESPQPGLDPRRRGSVLHRALECVWEDLGSHQRLLEVQGAERRRLAERCVEQALKDKSRLGETEWEHRFRALEQERVTALVEEWLQVEEQRAPFHMQQQESKRPATLGGLTVNLQADRVDELAGGGRVLLDYKTGAAAPRKEAWEGERPDEPQLPIYAATMEADVAAVAFAHVRRGKSKFIGHARAGNLLPEVKPHPQASAARGLEPLVAEWRQVLERLAAGFRAGEAAVDPRDGAKTCKFCHLPGLCRIRELDHLRLAQGAEDGAEDDGEYDGGGDDQ